MQENEDDGEEGIAVCFMSLSMALRSVDIMRNCHENESVEGYEPGVLRILTASPTTLSQSSQATPHPQHHPIRFHGTASPLTPHHQTEPCVPPL